MNEQTDTAEAADGQSRLTAVLGVGSTRMHPHANKFHAGNGDDGKHYWLTPTELYDELKARGGPLLACPA